MSVLSVSKLQNINSSFLIEADTVTISGDFYNDGIDTLYDDIIDKVLYTWVLQYPLVAYRDLHLKRNELTPTTINISAGYVFLSGIVLSTDYDILYDFTAEYTLDCSTTGANGLDTGSLAPSTWYYFYLIGNIDSNVVVSTASTNSVYPAEYPDVERHKYLLVGAMKTNGSSQFYDFYQIDRTVSYVTGHKELDRGHATSEEEIVLDFVPPDITEKWIGQAYSEWSSGGGSFSIRSDAGSILYKVGGESAWINYKQLEIPLSQSQKLFYLKDSGSTLGLTLETTGFELQKHDNFRW